MAEELEFFDELPGRMQGRTRAHVDALIANPGKWARWPTQQGAHALKKVLAKFGEFECVTRSINGKPRAFVRYVGNGKPDAVAQDVNGEGPLRIPGQKAHDANQADTWTITCPACSAKLPVPVGATQADIAGVKSKHRKSKPNCDAILKRRAKVW